MILRTFVLIALGLSFIGCSRSPEAQRDKHLETGKAHFAAKDYPRALLAFRGAAKAMPSDPEPLYRLGITALAMDDSLSGADFLERALRLNSNHLEAMIELGALYVRSRDEETLRRGLDWTKKAAAKAPEDPRPVNILALGDIRLAKPAAAVARLEPLIARLPNHRDSYVNLARARVSLGDTAGARAALELAVKNLPKDPKARFAIAEFLTTTGDAAAAVPYYEAGLQMAPDDGRALGTLGSIYAHLGQHDKADRAFVRLASNPDRQFRFAHVGYLLSSNKRDHAISELLAMSKKDVADTEARGMLIEGYLQVGKVAEAESLLTKAVADNPRDRDALINRARIKLIRDQALSAEEDIMAALALEPGSAPAHYVLATIHRKLDRLGLQKQELTETLRLDASHVKARAELAALLTSSNDAKGALALLDAAPAAQRESPELLVQRNWALIETQQEKEARTSVDRMLAAGSNPELVLQDAALRAKAKDWVGARASLNKVLNEAPADPRALDLLASISQVQNTVASDLEFLRRFGLQHPGVAHVPLLVAKLELQSGNAERARTALEAAKKADEKLHEADLLLGELDRRDGKYDLARARLTKLLGSQAGTEARRRLAEVEYEAGEYSKASEHYRQALENDPRDVAALNNLAYILAEHAQKPDEALQYAQKAKELAPEDASIDDTLGWTYFKKAMYSAAITHLEAAVRRAPTPRKQLHLGLAYAKAGQGQRSIAPLEAGLRSNPKWPEVALARAVLAEKKNSPAKP